ncbi:hypothetical protein F5Y18DRAFT_440675 [Xylariaceae sp. FL1019]|nr:hypothetical protein F5Y18DRAFT_440675 [Xylariaceae sp. FL1019]
MVPTTDRLDVLCKLRCPTAIGRSHWEEDEHPWRVISSEPVQYPLLRIWDRSSGSQTEQNGGMVARASSMQLDGGHSRRTALANHHDPENRVPTPFISFTTSFADIEDLANRWAAEGRGALTLTVIDPNVRLRKGMPLLSVRDEMVHYAYDSYSEEYVGFSTEARNDDYLALWEVTKDEIVGHWNWSDLRRVSNQWYHHIILPTFTEFAKRTTHDTMGEWLKTHFIYIDQYQQLWKTYNDIRLVAFVESRENHNYSFPARKMMREQWWAKSKTLLQTPEAFLTKASREQPPSEDTLRAWVLEGAEEIIEMRQMVLLHQDIAEFLWERLVESGCSINGPSLLRKHKRLSETQHLKLLSGLQQELSSDLKQSDHKEQPAARMSSVQRLYTQSRSFVNLIGSTITSFTSPFLPRGAQNSRPETLASLSRSRSESGSSTAVATSTYEMEMDDLLDRNQEATEQTRG